MALSFTFNYTENILTIEDPGSFNKNNAHSITLSEALGFSDLAEMYTEYTLPNDEHFVQCNDSVFLYNAAHTFVHVPRHTVRVDEIVIISTPIELDYAHRVQTRISLGETVTFTEHNESFTGTTLNLADSVGFDDRRFNFVHLNPVIITYYPTYNSFSRYSNMNMRHGSSIRLGSARENRILFLTSNNNLLMYPGGGESKTVPQLRTKDFYIEHGVIQKFLINYDNAVDTKMSSSTSEIVYATIYTKSIDSGNDEITSEKTIRSPGENVWRGIGEGAGTGFKSNFFISGVRKAHSMILKYKTRLTEN